MIKSGRGIRILLECVSEDWGLGNSICFCSDGAQIADCFLGIACGDLISPFFLPLSLGELLEVGIQDSRQWDLSGKQKTGIICKWGGFYDKKIKNKRDSPH